MAKIYVTRKIPEHGLNLLKDKFQLQIGGENIPTKEDLMKGFSDADGAITLLTEKIDEEILSSSPKLKIIANYATGFDNIDLKAATERGICVTNTPGVLSGTTADLAFTLMLSVARRIPEADNYVKRGEWTGGWNPLLMLGSDIHGKTPGIVGMGRIGTEVAKRARGFNMNIIYSDSRENPTANELGAKRAELDELLKNSDFISIHVPLIPETMHLFNSENLSKMKETAFLINTSRGAVIDQSALVKALSEKTIAGAGLDVFETEPIKPDDPLLRFKNVVLLPHIGSASTETRSKMADMAANNIISFFQGKVPPQLLNKEAWKSP